MTAGKRRVAVLISGRGSNMEALADACAAPDYPAMIAGVLSDVEDAPGLQAAARRGIATAALPRGDFASKREHEAAIHRQLVAWRTEFVCLAGFMRLLSGEFIAPWQGRIINIHPSLLPRHRGLDTHRRAREAGDAEHGCSVHHVTAGMDEGPVIAQARVPVLAGDTSDTLGARVLAEEHQLYPEALRALIAETP
ncbi:phosphoribosylglycinamide formyltransferase [Roseitalea porphyridii]|uniref:Phosphoribosylglycinamide formyltransferase n=1 Tax=Roseitalea porphyridii TaxID=1852022 RepID=A0A4P6UZ36_9HYPH|nr:phosphoribosylglycinamide formyltransferase [Roseitalea porphyridii]QBK30311.1 phosphoribosylglycinamide formyltransferase [Roseitalea porphyridii]